jgi:type II secretory pathway component PulJ
MHKAATYRAKSESQIANPQSSIVNRQSSIANPQSSIVNRQSSIHDSLGFTLVEMLVAVSVLMVLMAGFTMLFTGSVRTVRSSLQQTDAYDRASGALSSIKADLLGAFNGRDAGNKFSFYGTPIGMTFVGLVKNRSDYAGYDETATPMQNTDLHLARVTYVLHHGGTYDIFPGGTDGTADAYSHRLLRYVEMNAADLDSFPVRWDMLQVAEGVSVTEMIEEELYQFLLVNPDKDTPDFTESWRRAKKCEIWIRMLAGGDNEVPNAWLDPSNMGRGDLPEGNVAFLQFVLTDSVVTTVPPFSDPAFAVPGYNAYPFSGQGLFSYDYARPTTSDLAPNCWWNDPRSINCQGGNSFCSDTTLPEFVSVNIMLMFKAPYPSAPDFQKLFTMQINLPAAYTRQAIISGAVLNVNGIGVSGVTMQVVPDPDLGAERKTDATGYYSIMVRSGWTGVIRPLDRVGADPQFREYHTGVTTHISDQNYEVP